MSESLPDGSHLCGAGRLPEDIRLQGRVVLVPTVFIGQFSKYTTEEDIFSALYELGFTHVFQVEFTADMIHREMLRQMELAEDKPVISRFARLSSG